MVIGSTLVSLATTSPELVVSIMASLHGESGLAIGNAVGSCICNISLTLGCTAAIKHIDVHFGSLRTPLVTLFLLAGTLFVMTLDLVLSQRQGAALIAIGLGYFVYDFYHHKRMAKPAEIAEAKASERGVVSAHSWLKTGLGTGVQFSFGAIIVVAGSKLLVDAAVGIAGILGVSPLLIGLTVVALGTSLPELTTALTSSRKNVSDLAVGNILGANIANLSLIVGTASVIHAVRLSRTNQILNFPAMLLVMLLLLWMLFTDRKLSRNEGAGLLAFSGAYLVFLLSLGLLGAA